VLCCAVRVTVHTAHLQVQCVAGRQCLAGALSRRAVRETRDGGEHRLRASERASGTCMYEAQGSAVSCLCYIECWDAESKIDGSQHQEKALKIDFRPPPSFV
jgi:hypothetical protein